MNDQSIARYQELQKYYDRKAVHLIVLGVYSVVLPVVVGLILGGVAAVSSDRSIYATEVFTSVIWICIAGGVIGFVTMPGVLWFLARKRILIAAPLVYIPATCAAMWLFLAPPSFLQSFSEGILIVGSLGSFYLLMIGVNVLLPDMLKMHPPNVCPKCNYDLVSTASSGCPECGWGRGDSR